MPVTLSESELGRVEDLVMTHLQDTEFISNRQLRPIANITYDQAIYFFNHMIRQGRLSRVGIAAGTKYCLPNHTRS